MSGVDVVQLLGALGVGALGAAVVQGIINARTSEAQRTHEATIRQLDRDHELHLARLADARSIRDRRSQRMYSNLSALAGVALVLGERTDALRLRPDGYKEGYVGMGAAYDKLLGLRADVLLDAETEPLLRRVNDAGISYEAFLGALKEWTTLRDSRRDGLAEQTKEVERTGQIVIDLMNVVLAEARATLATAEAAF